MESDSLDGFCPIHDTYLDDGYCVACLVARVAELARALADAETRAARDAARLTALAAWDEARAENEAAWDAPHRFTDANVWVRAHDATKRAGEALDALCALLDAQRAATPRPEED